MRERERPSKNSLRHFIKSPLDRWAVYPFLWRTKESINQNFFHIQEPLTEVKWLWRHARERFQRVPASTGPISMPAFKFLKIQIQVQIVKEENWKSNKQGVPVSQELHTSMMQSPPLPASSRVFRVILCICPLWILQNLTVAQTIYSKSRISKQIAWQACTTSVVSMALHFIWSKCQEYPQNCQTQMLNFHLLTSTVCNFVFSPHGAKLPNCDLHRQHACPN